MEPGGLVASFRCVVSFVVGRGDAGDRDQLQTPRVLGGPEVGLLPTVNSGWMEGRPDGASDDRVACSASQNGRKVPRPLPRQLDEDRHVIEEQTEERRREVDGCGEQRNARWRPGRLRLAGARIGSRRRSGGVPFEVMGEYFIVN